MQNPAFNAQHSPVGAFSSFTLGQPGATGGFGVMLGKPADQQIYIGAESAHHPGTFEALPFFQNAQGSAEDFVLEDQGDVTPLAEVRAIPLDSLQRRYTPCTDTWQAGDLSFTIYTPTWKLPDPQTGSEEELKKSVLPALFMELTLDNRSGANERRLFFGYQPDNLREHIREDWALRKDGFNALCCGNLYGVANKHPGGNSSLHFNIQTLLGETDRDRYHFGNATTGILDWIVPAGQKVTIQLVAGFHCPGIVTSGLECRFLYNRYYPDLSSVLRHGLEHFQDYRDAAVELDRDWQLGHLSEAQQFHLVHSIHSYYGSTQLLEREGKPVWVVNEGEYRMMNTLDLAVDQLFFEMQRHPWTTRNMLDQFVDHYAYHDEVFFPGQDDRHPGGISFCHDMGVGNCFSSPGQSSYEVHGLKGCFSYMTHEELVNWLLCALVYAAREEEGEWVEKRLPQFEACLQSLLHRDHPDSGKRNGIMSLDSCKTRGGAEITTYDSLDISLGQSRNNTYLAIKTWACYVGLERLFQKAGKPGLAESAAGQAGLCADTLIAAVAEDGTLPAVMEKGTASVIIPVIEGLVFPGHMGCPEAVRMDGPYGSLIGALKKHFESILQKDLCLFKDGGWKLSSTSTNSWLSKIYLCQHVARSILGLDGPMITDQADMVHREWLLHPDNAYWAWGDQMYAGIVRGSRYYPRGVTSCLWLEEGS